MNKADFDSQVEELKNLFAPTFSRLEYIRKKQAEVLTQFDNSAQDINCFGLAILFSRETGRGGAITTGNLYYAENMAELIIEMVASYSASIATEKNIPPEHFKNRYCKAFDEKFMQQSQENEDDD